MPQKDRKDLLIKFLNLDIFEHLNEAAVFQQKLIQTQINNFDNESTNNKIQELQQNNILLLMISTIMIQFNYKDTIILHLLCIFFTGKIVIYQNANV